MQENSQGDLFLAVSGLMSVSKVHRTWTITDLGRLIYPPIRLGQYYSFQDPAGKLIGFFTWANLTEEAEAGLINRSRKIAAYDWPAGDTSRIWFVDGLAPYGGAPGMIRSVRERIREKAAEENWIATRARWTRCYGTGVVHKIGHAA